MKLIYRVTTVLLSLLSLPAQAAYKVDVNAPFAVRSLLTDHLDLVHYQDRTDLSDEQVQFLIDSVEEQVTQLLSTEGYFTPTTVVDVTEVNDSNNMAEKRITLTIETEARTRIAKVDIPITGAIENDPLEQITALRDEWELPVGAPFRQSDWDSAKSKILNKLQNFQYPAARIRQSRAQIDPKKAVADLLVEYDSGPVFTLGALNITGLKRYPRIIIDNVNPLHPGEVYSVQRLQNLQRQIQNTAYFSNVIVSVDDNPALADGAPVNVHVSEYPTQRTRLGVGFATDTGMQLESRYTHYNVFDKAWVFDGQAKIEQRRQYGSLQLAMPPDSKGYVNSIGTGLDRSTLQGVELRNFRMGFERSRSGESYDTAYSLTYYLDELQQENGAVLPSNTITAPGMHQALVPGFKWARRKVDNPIFPRSGNLFTIETGVAVKGLATDQTFARLYSRYKQYIPIFKKDLVILRAEFGGVFTSGNASEVPASLLFRAGGSDSVRGYDYQSIGNDQGGTIYPTKYMTTVSAEYQYWFNDTWGSAVFYDAGTATNSTENKKIYQGVGAGARWRSPVGTVQIDLAYGLQKQSIRPHISLGIAF